MIRYILLDLDNTLLDFDRAEAEAVRTVLLDTGLQVTDEMVARYHEINDWHWKQFEKGMLTKDQVLYGRFDRLLEELCVEGDGKEICIRYETQLSLQTFFVDGALELLQTLQKENYHLFLVSNGTPQVQYPRLMRTGLDQYFDDVFLSMEIGAAKPSKLFFEYCFDRIPAFAKEECIIIGDSLSSDIQGGKNAGIRTCLFAPKGSPKTCMPKPDYIIRTLMELPLLLTSI